MASIAAGGDVARAAGSMEPAKDRLPEQPLEDFVVVEKVHDEEDDEDDTNDDGTYKDAVDGSEHAGVARVGEEPGKSATLD